MGYSFKFNFKDSDIDFSPKANGFYYYNEFLINEFFNSNDFESVRIMEKYRMIYGDSAYKHVISTYFRNWRSGDRTLSNVQYDRIVHIMKDCLNESAKDRLEKIKEESRFQLGIEETLKTIKRTVGSFFPSQSNLYKDSSTFLSTNDIINLFILEINRVKKLQIKNDNVFEKIYVLDLEELEEVLNISKYIIFIKLKIQFENILNDIDVFFNSINFTFKGINTFFYKIDGFSNQINLAKFEFKKIDISHLNIDEIETSSKYKLFADNYLLEELARLESQMDKDSIIRKINDLDLSIFQKTTQKLIETDKDFQSKTVFNGAGGILTISIDFKNLKNLKDKLLYYYLIIFVIGVIILFIYYQFYINDHFVMALFLTFFVWSVFGFIFDEYIKIIANIRAELKKYS